jgi:drug/metabolite transporter (DMT)-like permease
MSKGKKTKAVAATKDDDAFNQEHSPFLLPSLVIGVWGSFLLFGWATEALTRTKYEDANGNVEVFKFTSVMTIVQCACNSIVAAVAVLATGNTGVKEGKNGGKPLGFLAGVPILDWCAVAGGLLGAHKFGYGALAYIPFPLQVMVKSAKTIPVLIGDVVIAKARPKLHEIVEVIMLTLGIVWFLYFKPSKKKGADFSMDSNMLFGIGMAMCALVCDGFYGPYQNKIVKKYQPTSWHMMLNANSWQGLMCLPLCLLPMGQSTSEIERAIAFAGRHPEVYNHLILFASMMALGQSFIYLLARNYGAVTVTLTTTCRKFATVLLSSLPPPIGFGNVILPIQYVGVVGVFGSKLVGKYLKGQQKKDKKKKE